jgi:hypothetical protein
MKQLLDVEGKGEGVVNKMMKEKSCQEMLGFSLLNKT